MCSGRCPPLENITSELCVNHKKYVNNLNIDYADNYGTVQFIYRMLSQVISVCINIYNIKCLLVQII